MLLVDLGQGEGVRRGVWVGGVDPIDEGLLVPEDQGCSIEHDRCAGSILSIGRRSPLSWNTAIRCGSASSTGSDVSMRTAGSREWGGSHSAGIDLRRDAFTLEEYRCALRRRWHGRRGGVRRARPRVGDAPWRDGPRPEVRLDGEAARRLRRAHPRVPMGSMKPIGFSNPSRSSHCTSGAQAGRCSSSVESVPTLERRSAQLAAGPGYPSGSMTWTSNWRTIFPSLRS